MQEGDVSALAVLMRKVAEKTREEVKKRLYDTGSHFHHPFGFAYLGQAYEVHGSLTELDGDRLYGVRFIVSKVLGDGTLREFIHVNF